MSKSDIIARIESELEELAQQPDSHRNAKKTEQLEMDLFRIRRLP